MLAIQAQTSFAHGDLHERILLISEEIESAPDNSTLYFERGKLYFYHEQYLLSVDDLDKAGELGYNDFLHDLFYAKAYQKLNNNTKAIFYTDKILSYDSKNVNAIKIKAEVLFKQKEFETSALFFQQLINKSKRTLPENYTQAAKAYHNCTGKKMRMQCYVVLDKGINTLGELPTLLKEKIRYYKKDKLFPEALLVQKEIIKNSQRKETAYFEAALLAIAMKDSAVAKQYLKQSENALFALPKRIQLNKSMQSLLASISKQKNLLTNKH